MSPSNSPVLSLCPSLVPALPNTSLEALPLSWDELSELELAWTVQGPGFQPQGYTHIQNSKRPFPPLSHPGCPPCPLDRERIVCAQSLILSPDFKQKKYHPGLHLTGLFLLTNILKQMTFC